MWFYITPFLAKKPTPFAQPIENICPDDCFGNHDHERKRLISWIRQRSRDRFMAEGHNIDAKPAPLLVGSAFHLPERSSLVPHIKSPPQVFTSTLHSIPRSVVPTHIHPERFTTIPDTLSRSPAHISLGPSSPAPSTWSYANPILPPPHPKVNPVTSDIVPMSTQRIEAYLQGSSVRDSLDLEAHRSRGRMKAVDNHF